MVCEDADERAKVSICVIEFAVVVPPIHFPTVVSIVIIFSMRVSKNSRKIDSSSVQGDAADLGN
jgi:hypothetical protein